MVMIGVSDILTAFNENVIGSKVLHKDLFLLELGKEISKFDFQSCRVPGQAYITLPDRFCKFVSSGLGRRTDNVDDYIIRFYREKVGLYLKRQYASEVKNVSVVVYTTDAYLNDPDITIQELNWIKKENPTHILVAVLASPGFESPLTPYRFVHNLAGGNNEAKLWTGDEIREMAKKIINHSNNWCIVSD